MRAVVEAYGEGKIELPKPPSKTGKAYLRYAPKFSVNIIPPGGGMMLYTTESLAAFLDWKPWKVDAALKAPATDCARRRREGDRPCTTNCGQASR